eukprot:jgi/Ulvmu1/6529/UM003_0162.1
MASFAADSQRLAEARAQAFFEAVTRVDPSAEVSEPYDSVALADVANVRCDGPGQCTVDVPVTTKVCNWMGNLHGGCTATLVDTVGSAAIATISDNPSVSVHISTEYLAPVAKGDTAVVEAAVLQRSKRLCTIEVRVRSKSTGALAATGMHQKYIYADTTTTHFTLGRSLPIPQWTAKLWTAKL